MTACGLFRYGLNVLYHQWGSSTIFISVPLSQASSDKKKETAEEYCSLFNIQYQIEHALF